MPKKLFPGNHEDLPLSLLSLFLCFILSLDRSLSLFWAAALEGPMTYDST